jgi:hypothetical protein
MTDKNDIQFPLQWNSIITKQATGAQFQSRECTVPVLHKDRQTILFRDRLIFSTCREEPEKLRMLDAVAMTPSRKCNAISLHC